MHVHFWVTQKTWHIINAQSHIPMYSKIWHSILHSIDEKLVTFPRITSEVHANCLPKFQTILWNHLLLHLLVSIRLPPKGRYLSISMCRKKNIQIVEYFRIINISICYTIEMIWWDTFLLPTQWRGKVQRVSRIVVIEAII